MIHVNNFSNGALNPVLAYLMSCVGCFLGLRCATRARAYSGAARARWLTLAALAIATTGIWVMHFIAMLGFTIPGQTIRYNVVITIVSMLIAVIVVGIGTFIVGFSRAGTRPLLLGGLIIGLGVASMHYLGMAAIRVQDSLTYNPALVAASVVIAVIAGIAALWAALRLDTLWSTFIASLIMGVAVSGMHYTGMVGAAGAGRPRPGREHVGDRQRGGVPAAAHPRPEQHRVHLLRRDRRVADGGRDLRGRRADEADRPEPGRAVRAAARPDPAGQRQPSPPGTAGQHSRGACSARSGPLLRISRDQAS